MASKFYNKAKIVRLTEQEERTIINNAEANSLSVSRYLAKCGVKKTRSIPKKSQFWLYLNFHLLLFLIYELKKIGVNLNQIVRDYHVSQKGKGLPPTIGEIEKIGKSIQKLIDKIVKIL